MIKGLEKFLYKDTMKISELSNLEKFKESLAKFRLYSTGVEKDSGRLPGFKS